jgi:NADP-dependent 3-hydroxy acid dehydrogenase YdfG
MKAVASAFKLAIEAFGHIDVLIQNAGYRMGIALFPVRIPMTIGRPSR